MPVTIGPLVTTRTDHWRILDLMTTGSLVAAGPLVTTGTDHWTTGDHWNGSLANTGSGDHWITGDHVTYGSVVITGSQVFILDTAFGTHIAHCKARRIIMVIENADLWASQFTTPMEEGSLNGVH